MPNESAWGGMPNGSALRAECPTNPPCGEGGRLNRSAQSPVTVTTDISWKQEGHRGPRIKERERRQIYGYTHWVISLAWVYILSDWGSSRHENKSWQPDNLTLLSIDMKTKVVQHVPRIIQQLDNQTTLQVPSTCLTFRIFSGDQLYDS